MKLRLIKIAGQKSLWMVVNTTILIEKHDCGFDAYIPFDSYPERWTIAVDTTFADAKDQVTKYIEKELAP